jgi:hypothetical protein
MPVRDIFQSMLRLVELPPRCRDATVLVGIGIAQHDLGDVALQADDCAHRFDRQAGRAPAGTELEIRLAKGRLSARVDRSDAAEE